MPLPEGSATQLVLSAGSAPPKTFDIYIGRLPLVIDVAPKFGAIGDPVVLTGRGFMPDPHQNAVTFAGQPALVLKASTTSLTVIAPPPPPDEVQPDLPVVVAAGGRASTGAAAFKLTRTSSSGYLPRFFAAPVVEFPGSGYAFVSTELGPVLLLGGSAEAASTADRAVTLAAALNALVTNAEAKPPAFELRERPQPGVGVVGDVRTFLVPTAEDAEAYSKNWETGRGAGRRVAPAAVARHWAALLQDYFGLFLYRQRPLRLAAISPRGKVFTEIYGEANRQRAGRQQRPDERRAAAVPEPRDGPAARGARGLGRRLARGGGRRGPLGRDDGRPGLRQARVPGADAPGGRPPRGYAHHLARLDRAQVAAARDRLRAADRSASRPTCRGPRSASRARSRTPP